MGLINAVRASYGALKCLYRLSGFLNLFCRRFDRAANCALREKAELPGGFVNGQSRSPLAEMPYGAWRMGANGCEVIAAYNALLALNRPESLTGLAAELEQRGLLFNGFGGTHLAALADLFSRRGIPTAVLRRRDRKNYDAALSGAEGAVLSYWTGKTLRRRNGSWNTLHTVFVRPAPGGVSVYNADPHSPVPDFAPSVEGFLCGEGGEPVCLFVPGKIG